MPYIGTDINYGNIAKQTGTGDGSDTTPIAALTYTVPSNESILVFLDGVAQVPGTDFTATGITLTFTTAPASGVAILVMFLGRSLDIGTPGANTVDETKLKDALIGDFTDATVTASDYFLHGDATDSGNTKKDTVQGILDLAGGGIWTSLQKTTVSDQATVDFPSKMDSSLYVDYRVVFRSIVFASDNKNFQMLLSDDDGVSYETTSYAWGQDNINLHTSITSTLTGAENSGFIQFMNNVGNVASTDGVSGEVYICDPHNASTRASWNRHDDVKYGVDVWWERAVNADHDAIRFRTNSGNITSGEIELFGLAT